MGRGDKHAAASGCRRELSRNGSAGLGYGQTFFLIFGFLITSALIFLFGIWVGRDVAERRLVQEERVVRIPMPTPPAASEAAKEADADAAFFQQLKEKAYQRLQETATPATPTATQIAETPTAPPAPTIRPTLPRPTPPPTKIAPKPTAVRTRAVAPLPKTTLPPEAGGEWADAGWTVQVNATTNVEQATEQARKLRAKGYEAYTVLSPVRGQTWYRVRVGRFPTREKAQQMEARLKADGLSDAYVTPQ